MTDWQVRNISVLAVCHSYKILIKFMTMIVTPLKVKILSFKGIFKYLESQLKFVLKITKDHCEKP